MGVAKSTAYSGPDAIIWCNEPVNSGEQIMKPKSFLALVLALGMGLCVTSGALVDEDDPPGRVGRLSYMDA